jgi:sigma-54 dependent transcriptional regulator, flagellar regulatory protein
MKVKRHLDSKDKEFFSLASKAIFTNPFSEEWKEIKKYFKLEKAGKEIEQEHYISAVFEPLNERLTKLAEKGGIALDVYSEDDRLLLKNALLFRAYHLFVPQLDELIQAQLQAKAGPATVPFADKLIFELTNPGLSHQEAVRYLGIFYQLRRAFYFISEALIGESPSMKSLRFALWNNVFTFDVRIYDRYLWNQMEDFSTMILGETGTGKGAAASAIGKSGFIPFNPIKKNFTHNFNETFISINLSQFPETLIESELFGHRKGSFTGAVENHKGLFERCSSHGSLFLDEIGDISIPIQIKLLKVLQERTFSPVGSHSENKFSGRVIAATNRPLAKLRDEGYFRDDFFYRLCSDFITAPPLRQRIQEDPSELERLAQLIITRMTGEKSAALTEMVMHSFKKDLPFQYSWPGNVRELEQAVRRILLTRSYKGDLTKKVNLEDNLLNEMENGNLKAVELLSQYCELLHKRFGTYEEVARRTGLDRRTVKKYLTLPKE